MDFKKFKPVASDDKSYTIEHPNGKKIFIDKAKLSQSAHKEILHLFAGAQVDPGSSIPTSNIAPEMAQQDPMASFQPQAAQESAPAPAEDASSEGEDLGSGEGDAETTNGFTRNSARLVSAKDQAAIDAIKAKEGPVSGDADYVSTGKTPEQAVASAEASLGRTPDSVEEDPIPLEKTQQGQLLEKEQGSLKQFQGEEQNATQAIAQAQGDTGAALAQMQTPEQILAKYQDNDNKLAAAYAAGKVDPQRLLHSMGTGSKISIGIGMILSGMGSATTGQPNLASQVLNKAIDNDIDAQKNDQTKNMNLWKMNREALGNDMAANLATKNQLLTAAQFKIQSAQTAALNPKQKLLAQQQIDSLEQQKLQNNMTRALLTSQSQGGPGSPRLSGTDPALLVPELVKDPEQKKAVLNEIKSRQNISKNGKAMLDAFDQAVNEVSGAGGVAHSMLEKTPGQLKLQQLMQPNMDLLDGTVRQNAVESAEHTIIPGWKDFSRPGYLASKRATLQGWMKSQMAAPVAKSNLIDLDRFQSTAIPNSPPAVPPGQAAQPKIKTVNGIKYMRGPNGEAIPVK